MTTATRPRDRLTRAEAHREILKWRKMGGHLAARVAARSYSDRADNFQAAMLGLCEAVKTFEPSRGNTFQTHGIWAVRAQLRDAARDGRRGGVKWAPTRFGRAAIPLTDLHRDEKLRARAHHPAVTDPEPDLDADDFWKLVRKHAVCRLDYLLTRAVYAHGLTTPQIAAALGVTRHAVRSRIARTLKRLRDRATEFEGFR